MRSLRSLKSTHWVMWSSPLLLLVLVFTLTSTPSKATSPTAARDTISTTTSLVPPTTTTTLAKRIATTASRHRAVTVTATLPHSTAPTTSTSVPSDVNSSSVIGSNVPSIANAPAETSASGALSGQLTARLDVAVVPLDGPGTWTVSDSAPIDVTLSCQGTSINVQTQFEIGAREECQVTISPEGSTASLTWQLTPNT